MSDVQTCLECGGVAHWRACDYCGKDGYCIVCQGDRAYWICVDQRCLGFRDVRRRQEEQQEVAHAR